MSQRVADNLLAVLREALTNAGKHAKATHYEVTLAASRAAKSTLEVVDNGVGLALPLKGEGMGLANLRSRAERLHGTFEITPVDLGGTRLTWRVPV